MSYLLSVIIPTKNRYKYLKECISTLIDINSDEIEILIQDNTFDNQEILNFLNDIDSKNIRYYHCEEELSQTENSELAVENSTGEYLCYIGDDDSVVSQILDVVLFMKKNNIDSCIFPVAVYYWPDIEFKYFVYPTLSFSRRSKKGIVKLNPKKELKKILRKGATAIGSMPKIYHGIVSRELMNQLKKSSGEFFPGPSPDMASSTGLSLLAKSHYYIDIPVLVSGYSFKSAGGMGVRGKHKAKLKDVAQIPKDTEDNWETKNPKIWLAATIWAESCSKTLKKMNELGLYDKLNWNYVYAKIITFNSKDFDEVKPFFTTPRVIVSTFFIFCKLFMQRVLNFFRNMIKTKMGISKSIEYTEVANLTSACKLVGQYLNNNNTTKILNDLEE